MQAPTRITRVRTDPFATPRRVIYAMDNGMHVSLEWQDLIQYGLRECLAAYNIDLSRTRLPVCQGDVYIGWVAGDFDPELELDSKACRLYRYRKGDFIPTERGWELHPSVADRDIEEILHSGSMFS